VGVVTLSSKFQVVIPQDVRAKLDLMPGQKIVVGAKEGGGHLFRQRAWRERGGFVKGLDTKG